MAQCLKPYELKTGERVPCGKCPNCSARRVSGWSFRLMQQNKIAETAVFLTLTYDTNNVPLTPKGYMTLDKTTYTIETLPNGKVRKKQNSSHLQSFFKQLRKAQFGNAKGDIKYYYCGEYGSKYNRPHYHVILFNAKLELIQDCWPHGSVHYGMDVNEASVGYTLKYMSKPSRIPMHKNDDRVPEYSRMSKGSEQITLLPKFCNTTTNLTSSCCVLFPMGKK